MKPACVLAILNLPTLLLWALLSPSLSEALTHRMTYIPTDLNEQYSVVKFSDDNVIGFLGHPLGTIVRVTGVALDGNCNSHKSDADQILLEISTVNGRKLDRSITFLFHRVADGIKKPEPGTIFDYYVHEYGEFDGVVVPPAKLGIKVDESAHDGFHYRRFITIHKSLN